MRSWYRILAIALGLLPVLAGAANADAGTRSPLTPIGGSGGGFVTVAPTSKDDGALSFDVQGTVNIHGASPDTAFTVLRRVDVNPNGTCTGATWLTLPGDPVLTTSAGGAGALHFELQRGEPFVDGVSFDVIWRAVGTDGTMLESECFTVTVK
ncbi:MAG: hypothetical protein ACRDF9_01960 [Candidatus Limnocylindria bacterium]